MTLEEMMNEPLFAEMQESARWLIESEIDYLATCHPDFVQKQSAQIKGCIRMAFYLDLISKYELHNYTKALYQVWGARHYMKAYGLEEN